ncbi:glycoside hydrolase 15 protein, partial [Quaeritorhiza haematococci]
MVQRRALLEGAAFAQTLNDTGASTFYLSQARLLEPLINAHWDSSRSYIREMIDTPDYYRREGRNIATILAVIHGYNDDGFYAATNERVLATAERLRADFEREYRVAGVRSDEGGLALGTPYGRYKEDVYDGSQGANRPTLGNPWFLAVLAMAELYYMAIDEYTSAGSITITPINLPFFTGLNISNLSAGATYTKDSAEFKRIVKGIAQAAEALVRRVKFHVGAGRRMAEQFHRDTGFQLSAEDLT